MTGTTRTFLGSMLLLTMVLGLWVNGGSAQPEKGRSDFMRKKLDYSKNVLEGLSREDYALVARNARRLKVMSEEAAWKSAMIPNATNYIPYTLEFQRLADELAGKADGKNLDGATLAYLQLTMNCINCHKYTRNVTK